MKPPLVLIRWEDSVQASSEWQHLEDVVEQDIVQCQSVGFLIQDGKRVKALAQNLGDEGTEFAQVSGIMRIPTRCVTKIVKLGMGE